MAENLPNAIANRDLQGHHGFGELDARNSASQRVVANTRLLTNILSNLDSREDLLRVCSVSSSFNRVARGILNNRAIENGRR